MVDKRECTRLPPHAKGVEFPSNGPLLQLPSTSNEKRADEPRQTCSNINSSTKSSYHRYHSIVSSYKIHECWIVWGIERVQTCSNIRASTSKFLYLRYYYYLRRMKLVEMIENRIRIDEQTQSNTYSLTFFDKFTVPSILRHRFHRHRMKLMEAEEGSVETTEENVVAS